MGHKGQFGHEFMEFELKQDGTVRYANNSAYKNDSMIRKQCMYACSLFIKHTQRWVYLPSKLLMCACAGKVSPAVMEEIRRIVRESKVVT